jgi:hypothetical protein
MTRAERVKREAARIRAEGAHAKEIERFHGASDVEYALGYSNLANFYGTRAFLGGDLPDRWTIAEKMHALGAEVSVVDTYDYGNPQKRNGALKEGLKGKKFDTAVLAMVPAFHDSKERVSLFKRVANRVDFKNGGRFGVTMLDFENFENHATKSDNQTVRDLGALNANLFSTVGFDRNAGRNLEAELNVAFAGQKDIQVEVSRSERPENNTDWKELEDLLAFQESIVQKALKSLPPWLIMKTFASGAKGPNGESLIEFKKKLNLLKAEINALKQPVRDILVLPEAERPKTQPPLVYRGIAKAQ